MGKIVKWLRDLWIKRYDLWLKKLSDNQVEEYYIKSGATFGDAVSYLYMGECVGFGEMLSNWENWELEYSRRGYRALPIDFFIKYGGYGLPLNGLGVKRYSNEKIVLHADIFRKNFFDEN